MMVAQENEVVDAVCRIAGKLLAASEDELKSLRCILYSGRAADGVRSDIAQRLVGADLRAKELALQIYRTAREERKGAE